MSPSTFLSHSRAHPAIDADALVERGAGIGERHAAADLVKPLRVHGGVVLLRGTGGGAVDDVAVRGRRHEYALARRRGQREDDRGNILSFGVVEDVIFPFAEGDVESLCAEHRIDAGSARTRAVDDEFCRELPFRRLGIKHSVPLFERGDGSFRKDIDAAHRRPVRKRDGELIGRDDTRLRRIERGDDALRKHGLDLERLLPCEHFRPDAVEVGAAFEFRNTVLSARGRRDERPALQCGHSELFRKLPDHGVAAHIETRFQSAGFAVVAGVHDAAVGARSAHGNIVASLQKADGNTAPRQPVGNGAADDPAPYHYNVICHDPPFKCAERAIKLIFRIFSCTS